MELTDQSDETVRTAKLEHDLPQSIMADNIKGYGQVHKGDEEVDILFLTLLWQLPCSKYHIYCSMVLTESILNLAAGLP